MSPVYYDNTFDRLSEAYENSNIRSRRVCIVGDTNTAPLYAEAVNKAATATPVKSAPAKTVSKSPAKSILFLA